MQATVEVQYVHLVARSGSAVKDQILYVPTRLEDIEELAIPLTMTFQIIKATKKKIYIDTMSHSMSDLRNSAIVFL